MEDRKIATCTACHIKALQRQAAADELANFSEPCEKCPYSNSCEFDWITILQPIFKLSEIRINIIDKGKK